MHLCMYNSEMHFYFKKFFLFKLNILERTEYSPFPIRIGSLPKQQMQNIPMNMSG
jgi:hypothetical protein